jgi:hypothetical protein
LPTTPKPSQTPIPTRPPDTPQPIIGDPYQNVYSTGAIAATVIMLGIAAAALLLKRKIYA